MSAVLEDICDDVREEVAARRISDEKLAEQIAAAPRPRDAYAALAPSGISVIGEVRRVSPGLMGVTGTRTSVSGNVRELVARIRETSSTPVAVGLGVSNKDQAHEVASYADGVIVGSAFIRQLQESSSIHEGLEKVEALARSLSEGVRR
jgi:tryptophan synthase alpha chain